MECNLVEYDQADQDTKEIYDDIMRTLQTTSLPNWVKAMGGNPRLLKGNWEKTKSTLVEGELPLLLKELIIFTISVKRGSQYCAACHAHSALQLDKSLQYEDLLEIVEGKQLDMLPHSYQVAIPIALKAAVNPAEVTQQDITELSEAGFSSTEISEIFAQADLAVMFNTITTTYKVPVDSEYKRGQGC